MLYALICTDKPNSLAIRKANRPDHLEYLQGLGDTLHFIRYVGPVLQAGGKNDLSRHSSQSDPFAAFGTVL
jgi:uncharacterized protein YciI